MTDKWRFASRKAMMAPHVAPVMAVTYPIPNPKRKPDPMVTSVLQAWECQQRDMDAGIAKTTKNSIEKFRV